ncbi:hypothetical protein Sjap_021981 [Stephania japonica]|uniref:Uncharacterized protein n=1 Tax=Stephania japonica TaxID=461633 RepID=A0AAP0ENE8_9MAGN
MQQSLSACLETNRAGETVHPDPMLISFLQQYWQALHWQALPLLLSKGSCKFRRKWLLFLFSVPSQFVIDSQKFYKRNKL